MRWIIMVYVCERTGLLQIPLKPRMGAKTILLLVGRWRRTGNTVRPATGMAGCTVHNRVCGGAARYAQLGCP